MRMVGMLNIHKNNIFKMLIFTKTEVERQVSANIYEVSLFWGGGGIKSVIWI